MCVAHAAPDSSPRKGMRSLYSSPLEQYVHMSHPLRTAQALKIGEDGLPSYTHAARVCTAHVAHNAGTAHG